MSTVESGVYPVFDIDFKIGIKGIASTDTDMKIVKDMTTFTFKISGKTDSWTPMDTKGWMREIMTGKSFSIALKGKRNVGDPGNDYVNATAWKDGLDCSTKAEIDFPDGSKLNFNAVIDVTNPGGDDSTKVTPLEFDLKSDGKPDYTPATPLTVLSLISSNPKDTDTGAALNMHPTLTFNNVLSSYENVLLMLDGSMVQSTVSLDNTGKVITIIPGAALTASKTYSLVLTGVTDIYGQVLANQVIKFTTATA